MYENWWNWAWSQVKWVGLITIIIIIIVIIIIIIIVSIYIAQNVLKACGALQNSKFTKIKIKKKITVKIFSLKRILAALFGYSTQEPHNLGFSTVLKMVSK